MHMCNCPQNKTVYINNTYAHVSSQVSKHMPQENDDATKVRKRQHGIDAVMRTPAYIITKLYYCTMKRYTLRTLTI